jgi:hypothetical protein
LRDVERAMTQVRPTVSGEYVQLYDQWRKQAGF